MIYAEMSDHELNKITSERAGKSRPVPFCGDLSLAMQLIQNEKWIMSHNNGVYKAVVTATSLDFYLATAATPARAIVLAWHMWQDGKNAPR